MSKKNKETFNNRTGKLGYHFLWFLGIADLCIGLGLTITNTYAAGLTIAGDFGPGGQPTGITGPGAIVVGIVIISLVITLRVLNKTSGKSR